VAEPLAGPAELATSGFSILDINSFKPLIAYFIF
jgi:hypothetical protein